MKLLIVEDDPRIAGFLDRGLRAEGHTVRTARNGIEGLEAVRSETPDVLVLDLMLPGMNGLDLCRTLRVEGYGMPVLMLTALDTLDDKVAGLRGGADDYLTKPFAFEELLARLDALARRGPPTEGRGAIRQIADLVFDRDRMEVTRGGSAIALTAKEITLLDLLMGAPGRVLSRERILANVWGTSTDPLTNIVDVYIRRLRGKIDEGRDLPLIHTVRGFGYTINSEPR